MIKKSKSELILLMQKYAKEENDNRTPTSRDMDKDKRYPSRSTYERVFGTWNNAVREAGFEPNIERPSKKVYSNQEMLQHLKKLSNELGRSPTAKNINKSDGPSTQTYMDRFGSLKMALEEAGLIVQRGYTESELFEFIDKRASELGHMPKYLEMLVTGYPSPMTYVNHFGKWRSAAHAYQEWKDGKKEKIHAEVLAKDIPILCRGYGINYFLLRDFTMSLIDKKQLDVYDMQMDDENAKKYMEFIKDNFYAICTRMNVIDLPKRVWMERKEEKDRYGRVVMVTGVLRIE